MSVIIVNNAAVISPHIMGNTAVVVGQVVNVHETEEKRDSEQVGKRCTFLENNTSSL